MSLFALFIVSFLTAGTIVYLVTHASIKSTILGKPYSPRLIWCRLLIPADIILSILLVIVPMFTGISGIGTFIASAFTAAGLSVGVFFVKKVMVPRWTKAFHKMCEQEIVISHAF